MTNNSFLCNFPGEKRHFIACLQCEQDTTLTFLELEKKAFQKRKHRHHPLKLINQSLVPTNRNYSVNFPSLLSRPVYSGQTNKKILKNWQYCDPRRDGLNSMLVMEQKFIISFTQVDNLAEKLEDPFLGVLCILLPHKLNEVFPGQGPTRLLVFKQLLNPPIAELQNCKYYIQHFKCFKLEQSVLTTWEQVV